MFTFLGRLGRLFVVTTILMAVGVILGVTSFGGTLVASHHNAASSMSCSVSSSGVGQQLSITGSGYTPSTSYLVDIKWPAGNTSGQTAVTDASGQLSAWNYAYYAGSYAVSVMTEGNHQTLVASCSTTVS